jgi:acyl-CoA reductase-like NAD-dependent aldehyde dehydrogenase
MMMATHTSEHQARDWGVFLAGEFRASGQAMPVRSPYDGSLVGSVAQPADADIEEAVRSSEAAFHEMSGMPAHRRAAILHAISAGIDQRREEIARTMALEAGKPLKAARVEVDRAVFNFRYAAEETLRVGHELLALDSQPAGTGKWAMVRRFPVGPILAITPFNFPLNLAVHKIAPALATGNTVVQKPAPKTPICSMLLAEIAQQAGIPAGALNVVLASISQTERLVRDDRLKMLTFTGSAAVGWKLKGMAGKKRVTLELGGNAAVIVHNDADLDRAAEKCAAGGFSYAGQVCISVQRVFVQRAVYDRFLSAFVDRVRALQVGDPLDEKTDVGPMISPEAAHRAEAWVNDALRAGANCLAGGKREGSVYYPTVLANTRPEMAVNCQEVFAPVVTVEPYDSLDAAISMVNDSPYGLQAGVFTSDLAALFSAYKRLQVGGVIANDAPTFRADPMPYGGTKDSGLGREGVRYAMQEMTEPKVLVLSLDS